MRNLFVVGGDGFARECYSHIESIVRRGEDVRFAGFVGHNGSRITVPEMAAFFVGELSEITFGDSDFCVVGVGRPKIRRRIFDDLKRKGARLYNLFAGDSQPPLFSEIGEGNIFVSTSPSPCVRIGNGNLFNYQVVVGHDVEIGDFNFFGPRSQLLGNVKVGNDNTLGAGSVLLPKAKIGDANVVAPLSAAYKGCRNRCYLAGNPALKVGDVDE